MSEGWIKLHRKLLANPRVKDPEWVTVWNYLLLSATHQPYRVNFDGRIVELKPGQLVTGRLAIAAATGVNESKVKRILEVMKNDQQIDQQAGVKGSIFTVLKWSTYQECDQQNDQTLTSDRPATDQQVTTNKNRRTKEHKEQKNTPTGENRELFNAFVSAFKEYSGETYSHQKPDFIHLANWRKTHPNVSPEDFAKTCRQVWADKFCRKTWYTLRGICSDWSSVVVSLKEKHHDTKSTRITTTSNKYEMQTLSPD